MDSLILSKDFWDNCNSQEHQLKLGLISKTYGAWQYINES